MRAVVLAGFFGGSVALCGCNVLAQVQAGPIVAGSEKKAHAGGEASAALYADMRAGDTWADCHLASAACQHPELARRAGLRSGVYVRGSDLGVAFGMEPGIFIGSTDDKKILLLSLNGRFGAETLHGTTYGTAGLTGAFTGGIMIHKSYDPEARILCRNLTYLTASLQGTIDYLPAAAGSPVIPAASLLFGVISLTDSGADADYGPSRGLCPR
jgi:hypothetical protein